MFASLLAATLFMNGCYLNYTRLETLQRSIQWARGTLVEDAVADELISTVRELQQEVQHISQDQASSSGKLSIYVGFTTCE